jgi:pimeloyl-ACP methyl ester carboxylesterase
MKKEIGSAKPSARKKAAEGAKTSRPSFRIPGLSSGVKKLIGSKPLIRYSHHAALKLFESLGFKFEVRHFGESRLGLLRWPLRKPPMGKLPRRLVMVPGFGDTPLSWWTVLAGMKPILKRQVDEVILIDYPGYSGFLHDEVAIDSMDELVRVFRDVVDSLKPEILIGHSLGGWLAADYAAERPDVVRQLILVDPGGLVTSAEDQASYRDLFNKAATSGAEHLLPHVFAKAPIFIPWFQDEFFAFLSSDEVRSFIGSFEDRHLLNGRIGKIRAETIILWGDRDTLTPTKWMEDWLAQLPTSVKKTGILIRGSGHSPQVEKPGVVIALLTQIFLNRAPKNLAMIPLWKVV